MANPLAPPDGSSRVRRNIEDAENAANASPAPPPATSSTDSATGINFFKGKVSTPEQKAKSGKALQDLLKSRAEADDDSGDATA